MIEEKYREIDPSILKLDLDLDLPAASWTLWSLVGLRENTLGILEDPPSHSAPVWEASAAAVSGYKSVWKESLFLGTVNDNGSTC
jgi:hypothetical protein